MVHKRFLLAASSWTATLLMKSKLDLLGFFVLPMAHINAYQCASTTMPELVHPLVDIDCLIIFYRGRNSLARVSRVLDQPMHSTLQALCMSLEHLVVYYWLKLTTCYLFTLTRVPQQLYSTTIYVCPDIYSNSSPALQYLMIFMTAWSWQSTMYSTTTILATIDDTILLRHRPRRSVATSWNQPDAPSKTRVDWDIL